jgi:AcrR family transcriptional regulator
MVGDVKSPPRTTRQPPPPSVTARPPGADLASRERVIHATVTCILERGYYRASTNEIARTAGVSWGVIQHYFGTRERLMLAVLQDGAHKFAGIVERAHIDGDTAEERITQLLNIFCSHYGSPEYLADMQILLNMDGDPTTSADVRKTLADVAEQTHGHVRRLLREALGPAISTPDLATTIFLAIRGFGLNQQLADKMSYDAVAPKNDRVNRQRRLLAEILAPYFEQLTSD